MSPSKLTTTRTGESSACFFVLSAAAMSSVTFQCHSSMGNCFGSTSRRWTRPEAEARALALMTVLPSCATSWYWVDFLNLDSAHGSQPAGSSVPGTPSEKLATYGSVTESRKDAQPETSAAANTAVIPHPRFISFLYETAGGMLHHTCMCRKAR